MYAIKTGFDNPVYWVNGILKKTISLDVRALHFGDGFFTTARLRNNKIDLLDQHLDRLVISANRLMFNRLDFDRLYKEILQAAACYSNNGVIKIIISRMNCNSTHGYACYNDAEKLFRIIRISPLPKYYTKWRQFGIKLQVSSIRLSRNSFLAGIKHLNRLEQVMISSNIRKKQDLVDEALVLDTEGNIIECCSSNIFWRQKNKIFTPALYYSGVNGVMRQFILRLLPKLGYFPKEVLVGIECLKNIDEIFITNSLLPLASVNSIDKYCYSDKTLCRLLSTYIEKEYKM